MLACSDYLSGTRGLWGESGDVGLDAVWVYRASSSFSLTVVSWHARECAQLSVRDDAEGVDCWIGVWGCDRAGVE